jgi:hypothetical protein
MSEYLDTNPYPTDPTPNGESLCMSWVNDCGETIVVTLDVGMARSSEPQDAVRAFAVRHSDMDGILLRPFITRFGGMFPKIQGVDGNVYLLRDEEAEFIDHAVRTMMGVV